MRDNGIEWRSQFNQRFDSEHEALLALGSRNGIIYQAETAAYGRLNDYMAMHGGKVIIPPCIETILIVKETIGYRISIVHIAVWGYRNA